MAGSRLSPKSGSKSLGYRGRFCLRAGSVDADARVQLARNLRGSVQKEIAGSANAAKKDTADGDSALITRITDESLQGTKVMKKAWGPDGTLYLLVGIDAKTAQKLHESINADQPGQKRK
ncbi:MAG: hypothetical protein Q7T21_07520 [Gallionella sp.]|nr:hypothetical protein [Gallionella sp.]